VNLMPAAPRLLLVTGGHPFQQEPLADVFDALAPSRWTQAHQPDAVAWFTPERFDEAVASFNVIVFYDMPGIRFTRSDPPTEFPEPPADLIEGMRRLADAGVGFVFLHHAIASWPATEAFANLLGGRFHYQPAQWNGRVYPDSGYLFDVTHHIDVIDPTHPVSAGLGTSFTLTDELYLFPVLEAAVTPLFRTTFPTDDPSRFYSADLAIRGERNSNRGWTHPIGSQLVGWTKPFGPKELVYLQFGDGPVTYADPNFRQVLGNAVNWVARVP
jgi:uncharacterized protein